METGSGTKSIEGLYENSLTSKFILSAAFTIVLIILISICQRLRWLFVGNDNGRLQRLRNAYNNSREEELIRSENLRDELYQTNNDSINMNYEYMDDGDFNYDNHYTDEEVRTSIDNNYDVYSDSDSDDMEDIDVDLMDPMDDDNDRQRIILDSLFNQMPNLWLKPQLLSMDYVYSLPTWKCSVNYNTKLYACSDAMKDLGDGGPRDMSGEYTENSEEFYTTCSSDEHSTVEDGELIPGTYIQCIQSYSNTCTNSNNLVNNELSKCNLQPQEPQQKCCKTFTKLEASGSELHSSISSVSSAQNSVIPVPNSSPIKRKLSHRKRKRRNRPRRFSRNGSISAQLLEDKSGDYMENSLMKREDSEDSVKDSGGQEESGPPSWMIEMHNCAFCLEDYLCGDELIGLPCAHNFHINCLAEWFRRDQRCPICRWPSYRFNHPRHQSKDPRP